MKSFLLSTVAGLGLIAAASAAASAADLPARPVPVAPLYAAPVFAWTGFYAGVNGGYGWGQQSTDWLGLASAKANGGALGGTVGFNQQIGALVLGVEGDLSWADFKGGQSHTFVNCKCVATETLTGKVDSYGTARVRLGYAMGSFLPYVTGGLYWQHAKFGYTYASKTETYADSASGSAVGWTLGGGVEVALTGHWSVKGEYLYARVNDNSVWLDSDDLKVSHRQQIVRTGLNYRF